MKQHILVTGGAGFIGSHLVDTLISRGYDVTILDKKKSSERMFVHPDARVIEIDMCHPDTMQLVKVLAPDAIVHLAANANVAKSVADPESDTQINYHATVRLLKTAKDIAVQKFIFASTGGALSTEETVLPTPEDKPATPMSPYAANKLASEKMGEHFATAHGMSFTALRFANVYGPRQSATMGEANVIATFSERMANHQPTSINGSGLQTRDYIYIDDVINAIVLALETPDVAAVINIGSGIETSVAQLHSTISKISGYTQTPIYKTAQNGEPQRSCLNVKKAAHVLGWSPTIPLDEGLKRTVDWVAQQLTQTKKQTIPQLI